MEIFMDICVYTSLYTHIYFLALSAIAHSAHRSQFLISSQEKSKLFGEMTDSRTEAENMQDEPRAPRNVRK